MKASAMNCFQIVSHYYRVILEYFRVVSCHFYLILVCIFLLLVFTFRDICLDLFTNANDNFLRNMAFFSQLVLSVIVIATLVVTLLDWLNADNNIEVHSFFPSCILDVGWLKFHTSRAWISLPSRASQVKMLMSHVVLQINGRTSYLHLIWLVIY